MTRTRIRTQLLRVEDDAETFASLIAAAREAGFRIGWLSWGGAAEQPGALKGAARLGVLRAVSIDEDRAVSVKPLRGQPVLRDVLREYFSGCRLVLVQGRLEAPLLSPTDSGSWEIEQDDAKPLSLTTARIVGRLRRPRFL